MHVFRQSYDQLMDRDGDLLPGVSDDGLHLQATGYDAAGNRSAARTVRFKVVSR